MKPPPLPEREQIVQRATIKEALEGAAKHLVRNGAFPEDVTAEMAKLGDNKAFLRRLEDVEWEEENRDSWSRPWTWWDLNLKTPTK